MEDEQIPTNLNFHRINQDKLGRQLFVMENTSSKPPEHGVTFRAVVELPPDGTLQTHDLALIREIAEAKVQSYLYSKSPRRSNYSRSSKHHHRSRRIRRNVIRRSEMQSETTEDTVYYISDAETSPSPGESFEFSEAECDMHLRLAMEERPV
ncbi:hypothetical protein AVEN_259751-1 [Araneus ventricosus]|uniref:Uncharacterized protein n=1 Tax=Araneus ventricosus TaxID=182803 RepID=A0A4Y2D422_ARAVE|nr:hypothetical protein AVEN_259751-1 [Araneus ventricosus]